MQRVVDVRLTLAVISAVVAAVAAPVQAAPPEPQRVTLVVAVDAGQLGVTLADDSAMSMAVMRAGVEPGTPAVAEQLVPGKEAVLEPGDSFIETGIVHSARTVGKAETVGAFTGLVETGQPPTRCV